MALSNLQLPPGKTGAGRPLAQVLDFSLFRAPAYRTSLTVLAWLLVVSIAVADYLSGSEITLRFLYCLPLAITVASRGRRSAFLMAVVCDASWQLGDLAAGAKYSSALVPAWNLLITLANYSAFVWLLDRLLLLQRDLEQRVQERTAALVETMRERERLEHEIMTISERERRSIGSELHEGICQHLTASAMAVQQLVQQLAVERPTAGADGRRVVKMIEEGIGETRRLAKGLLPVNLDQDGLAAALQEVVISSESLSQIRCDFHLTGTPEVPDGFVATHLFRIAQEAVRNAVRHSRANSVALSVSGDKDSVRIVVTDDGIGMPVPLTPASGLGLRIMAHRAVIIGAELKIESEPNHGTRIDCQWMRSAAKPGAPSA